MPVHVGRDNPATDVLVETMEPLENGAGRAPNAHKMNLGLFRSWRAQGRPCEEHPRRGFLMQHVILSCSATAATVGSSEACL